LRAEGAHALGLPAAACLLQAGQESAFSFGSSAQAKPCRLYAPLASLSRLFVAVQLSHRPEEPHWLVELNTVISFYPIGFKLASVVYRGASRNSALQLNDVAIQRVGALLLALLLAYFFGFVQLHEAWINYWVMNDGQQGMAIVTSVLWTGHNAVAYRYSVNQHDYTGEDSRNRDHPKYARVGVGEHSVVYFSSSHPWLSKLNRPRTAMLPGFPVLILAWLFVAFFLITAINPRSKWSLARRASSANL